MAILKTEGEAHEKAKKNMYEKLCVLENGMKEFFPNGKPKLDHKNIEVLDIIFCSVIKGYKAIEEIVGVNMLEEDKFPVLYSWLMAVVDLQVVEESTPPHEKVIQFLQLIRQSALRSTSA